MTFRMPFGKARRRSGGTNRGQMNGTEKAYAEELDILKAAGEIASWKYEAIKLRVTDQFESSHNAVWFAGDFLVLTRDGEIQVHEVKGGFADEKDILRLKCCADAYQDLFAFVLAQKQSKKNGGGWKIEKL